VSDKMNSKINIVGAR